MDHSLSDATAFHFGVEKVKWPNSGCDTTSSTENITHGTFIFSFKTGLATVEAISLTGDPSEVVMVVKKVKDHSEDVITNKEKGFKVLKQSPLQGDSLEIEPSLLSTEDLRERLHTLQNLRDSGGATSVKSKSGRVQKIKKERDDLEDKKAFFELLKSKGMIVQTIGGGGEKE
jgi:hypothetical protein